MLFRKNITPNCAYCSKGNRISDTQVACVKRGVTRPEDHCPAFRYDPLKRMPPRPVKLKMEELKQEDFAL